jgi:predicted ATPase
MINELARDRQVLVTTHDPNLLELLENCDVINVVKKDGFTTLASAEELTAA